jgi:rfaE bifunctional protein kinase chain/domain
MNADRFSAITRRYRELRIAVVGDFFLDRYLEIDPAKAETSIETRLPVYNVVAVRAQPGAAGTIVNNLAALGVGSLHVVGFCGDDGEGYELRQALMRRGVIVDDLLVSTSRRTPVYCKPLVIEPGAAPRELNRFDSKNWTPTPEDVQEELADRLVSLSDRVDAMILMDQVDHPETGAVTRRVQQAAHEALRRVPELFVVADSRRGLGEYPPLGFKMNAAELGRLCGAPVDDDDDVRRQATRVAKESGRPVFITMAERGIIGASGDDVEYVAAHEIRGSIDIVGAGDAVTANLTAALGAGSSMREAMELAMAAASVVIHQLGTTGTATVEQLRERVAQGR